MSDVRYSVACMITRVKRSCVRGLLYFDVAASVLHRQTGVTCSSNRSGHKHRNDCFLASCYAQSGWINGADKCVCQKCIESVLSLICGRGACGHGWVSVFTFSSTPFRYEIVGMNRSATLIHWRDWTRSPWWSSIPASDCGCRPWATAKK